MSREYVSIEILYDVRWYDGDATVDCTVRYSVPGDNPIEVDYDDIMDDGPDLAWKRAQEDIRDYVLDPEAWITNYNTCRTSDTGKRKEELKRDLARQEEVIEKYKNILKNRVAQAETLRTKIAELDHN